MILESAHPSPFSANHGFFGNNHFIKANEFLKESRSSKQKEIIKLMLEVDKKYSYRNLMSMRKFYLVSLNIFILLPSTIVIILICIYQTYLYYKSPNKSKNASYSVDDDDSFWILGFIYNNPNDPSVFVNKRFGAGWTVNIGSPKGKILFILPFVIILLSLIFI